MRNPFVKDTNKTLVAAVIAVGAVAAALLSYWLIYQKESDVEEVEAEEGSPDYLNHKRKQTRKHRTPVGEIKDIIQQH